MKLDGKLAMAGLTHTGLKRSHNEDAIGTDASFGIAVLADGMGGYKAGEVASAIAVETVISEVQAGLQTSKRGNMDADSGFSKESLLVQSAIAKANDSVYRMAHDKPECQGMGTTLVAAVFYDDRMTIAHVGDSRMYRFRNERLEQITVDHSLLQELVDKGFYTPEEAKQSLNKNLVTRAIGVDATVEADVQEDMVKPEDVYLLCSDGLSDLVEEDEIQSALEECGGELDMATESLVQMANDRGGVDNISVILARALEPFPAKRSWYSRLFDWF